MGADARIYASPTTDAKKNPLPFQEKVRFLRQLFPQVTFNSNVAVNNPFAAYADVSALGYKNITVIVGADRVRDFEKFGAYLLPASSSKYNAAKHIDVSQYRVLGIPRAAGAMSATLMRGYVVANDFPSFLAGTPGRNAVVAKKVFTSLRKHMRIREQKAYREAMIQKVSEATKSSGRFDKRSRPPIAGHPYHKKTDAQLRYIIKDASEAAKAMRGHPTPDAELKYLDQINNAVTVLYYRARGRERGLQWAPGSGRMEQVGLGITKRVTEDSSSSTFLRLRRGLQMKVAKEVYKQLLGRDIKNLLGFSPVEVVDSAVKEFKDGRGHRGLQPNRPLDNALFSRKFAAAAGAVLNKATSVGIKWNKKKITAHSRRLMNIKEDRLRGPAWTASTTRQWAKYPHGYAPGTRVKISGSGVAKRGKVVRYDKGDRHGSPFYVIDVGRARSEKIGAHNVQKEDVEHIEKDGVITFKEHLLNEVAEDWLDEAITKLGTSSANDKMRAAMIIFNAFTQPGRIGYPRSSRPRASQPSDIVDEAVSIFLKGKHTPRGWHAAGEMLNRATTLGIKWNQKLLRPITRKAMKMDEADTELDEGALSGTWPQMRAARIIFKSMVGPRGPLPPETAIASDIVDQAVYYFLKGKHTPKGWYAGGQMLNKATELGIKWNRKLIKPHIRKAMKMDEAVTKLDEGSKWEQMRHAIIIFKSLAPRNVKVPETAIASDIVNQAVYYFLSAMSLGDTAELRRVGQLLHKATQLGIKWNRKLIKPHIRNRMSLKAQGVLLNQRTEANEAVGNAPPKVGDRVRAGVGAGSGNVPGWSKAGFTGTVERIEGKWIYVNLGPEPGSKWGDRIIKAPRKYIMREAGISAPKPPSEVDRMKVRQTTDLITLKQRQATELMAAKIRDVETKAREAQTKATAPKSAGVSAS